LKRSLSFILPILMILMLLPCSAAAGAPAGSGGPAAAEGAAAAGKSDASEERVVLTIGDSKRLGLLLVERGEHPYKGSLALPGVFVRMEESVDAAAKRALNEETGLKDIPLVQVGTFGEVGRDPRMRVISVAYMAFVPSGRLDKCRPGEKECRVGVYEINDTLYEKLAFDHADIVRTALTRLRNRLDYTDEALDFVEDQEAFTIRELRQVYEAVKGDRIDAIP
jgi:8-oxo-dGTP diphosphatase